MFSNELLLQLTTLTNPTVSMRLVMWKLSQHLPCCQSCPAPMHLVCSENQGFLGKHQHSSTLSFRQRRHLKGEHLQVPSLFFPATGKLKGGVWVPESWKWGLLSAASQIKSSAANHEHGELQEITAPIQPYPDPREQWPVICLNSQANQLRAQSLMAAVTGNSSSHPPKCQTDRQN